MKPLMLSLAAFGVALSSHATEATKEIARRAFDFGPEVRGAIVVREGADGKLAAVCEGAGMKERTYKTWDEVPESIRRFMPGKTRTEAVVSDIVSKFDLTVHESSVSETDEDFWKQSLSKVRYVTDKKDFPLRQIEVLFYHDSRLEMKTALATRKGSEARMDSAVAEAKAVVSSHSKTEISANMGYRAITGVLTVWQNKQRDVIATQWVESVRPLSERVTMEDIAGEFSGRFSEAVKKAVAEKLKKAEVKASGESAPAPAAKENPKP